MLLNLFFWNLLSRSDKKQIINAPAEGTNTYTTIYRITENFCHGFLPLSGELDFHKHKE